MGLTPGKTGALVAFGLLFVVTWISPQWPVEQALHHSLTVIAVIGLVLAQRRWDMPLWCFVLLLLFLALHTVAARWIYSYVPYEQWLGLPATLGEADHRNNFDRFVHLSYGLCVAPVLFRYLADARGWRPGWAAFAAVDAIVSTGALYELLEWGIALALAPEYAEAYNGQQGDIFDPQKDMAIALLGALVATGLALALSRRRQPAPAVR